jgi:hypothetical protein
MRAIFEKTSILGPGRRLMIAVTALVFMWAGYASSSGHPTLAGAACKSRPGDVIQESVRGTVDVHVIALSDPTESRVVVSLDREPGESGRLNPDLVYVLQTDSAPVQVPTHSRIAEGRVDYSPGRLSISRQGEATPFLLLETGTGTVRASNEGNQRITGFGLSRTESAPGWTSSTEMSKDFLAWVSGRSLNAECSSGGQGSTSCSISGCGGTPSGCSVSCLPPAYSCCNCNIHGIAHCSCILKN